MFNSNTALRCVPGFKSLSVLDEAVRISAVEQICVNIMKALTMRNAHNGLFGNWVRWHCSVISLVPPR